VNVHPNRLAVVLGLLLAACAAPVPIDKAIVSYDVATADAVSKQLLLNIARARNNQPIHFTAVSGIAATYRLSTTAGIAAHAPPSPGL
jgi:outer membrane PBP1 activator LpoA protein